MTDLTFTDDFAGLKSAEDLLADGRWDTYEIDRGTITPASQGGPHVVFRADTNIGKADLVKAGFELREGGTLEVSGRFFFPETGSLDKVFILDLESKSALEGQDDNTLPGIRLALFGADGRIAVERGKIGQDTAFFSQDTVPRGTWTEITWEVTVGLDDEGSTRVLIDGDEVLSETGTTWIDPALAKSGGVTLNEDYAYDRVQVGLTANSSPAALEILVDDVSITATQPRTDWDDYKDDSEALEKPTGIDARQWALVKPTTRACLRKMVRSVLGREYRRYACSVPVGRRTDFEAMLSGELPEIKGRPAAESVFDGPMVLLGPGISSGRAYYLLATGTKFHTEDQGKGGVPLPSWIRAEDYDAVTAMIGDWA